MKKKLCKSTKNKKLAGVCAGFADYFGLDVTVVRLIVAVGTLFWGTGLWVYLICAIVLPNDNELPETPQSESEKGTTVAQTETDTKQ